MPLATKALVSLYGDLDLESILFQTDEKFKAAIRVEFQKIKDAENTSTKWAMKNTGLRKLLFKRFGLIIDVKLFTDENAYVPFSSMAISKSNPIHAVYQNPYAMDSEGKGVLRNKDYLDLKVDLANARVGGDLSKINHEIYMGTYIVGNKSDYSLDEGIAIFLHELGHIFTYYAALYASSSSNWLMNEFADVLNQTKETSQRIFLLKEAEKVVGLDKNTTEAIANMEDNDLIRVALYTSHMTTIRMDLGKNVHDIRGCEAMADDFSIRMGFGVALATGITRLSKKYSFGTTGTVIMNIITIASLINPIGILIFLLSIAGDSQTKMYDDPSDRINAIRNQLKESLRLEGADKAKAAELIRNLDLIEKDVKDLKVPTGVYEFIADHITPWSRGKYSHTLTQRVLENLARSELDVAAARLEQYI